MKSTRSASNTSPTNKCPLPDSSGHFRTQMRCQCGLRRTLTLQESLTNVHRHSGATQVSVCFLPKLETIVLEIRDNGCGITAERLNRLRETSAETGVGLSGMRERIHELNGELQIESDGHGTTLRAIVPRPARTRSDQLGDGEQGMHAVEWQHSEQQQEPELAHR